MAAKFKAAVNKIVKSNSSALSTAVAALVSTGKTKAAEYIKTREAEASGGDDQTVDVYVETSTAAADSKDGGDSGSGGGGGLSQPRGITATLMPHQIIGLNWLCERYRMGINTILADEMGLGKTLQSLCLLAHINERHSQRGPFLIICPLSVVDNWYNECQRFCVGGGLKPKVYIGDKKVRTAFQQSVGKYVTTKQPVSERSSDPQLGPASEINLLITTYELVMNDSSFLSRFQWKAVVLDEAHRLKNSDAKSYQLLMTDYKFRYKLLLTGTPCQNNLEEMWSLLHFLHPKVFTDKKAFARQYGAVTRASKIDDDDSSSSAASGGGSGGGEDEDTKTGNSYSGFSVLGAVSELHSVIRPFMLRRLKEQVALKIPPAREVVVYTPLSDMQKQYYKFVLTKNASALGGSVHANSNSRSLLNIIMALRKCCNHPYLFNGAEPEPFVEGDHIWMNSGKFTVIDKLLSELKAQGRRVLMFSTSVQTLDILQDYLSYRGYSYERLDGSVRGEERFLAIERFQKTDETFVFLLSTRAGGIGLNLTQADTVIFVDSDWNPQIDLQAQARVHRIGQQNKVLVIRLIAANTVEEIIQTRTAQKLKMTKMIIENGKFHNTGAAGAAGADDKSKGMCRGR